MSRCMLLAGLLCSVQTAPPKHSTNTAQWLTSYTALNQVPKQWLSLALSKCRTSLITLLLPNKSSSDAELQKHGVVFWYMPPSFSFKRPITTWNPLDLKDKFGHTGSVYSLWIILLLTVVDTHSSLENQHSWKHWDPPLLLQARNRPNTLRKLFSTYEQRYFLKITYPTVPPQVLPV